MTTIKCGRNISIDISNVSPGIGEEWIANDPLIEWGDGATTSNATGTTANHTYTNIGEYTITLAGQNVCLLTCEHTEHVVVIEEPTGLTAVDPNETSATVSWTPVPGCTEYYWYLYSGGNLIDDADVSTNSKTFTGLVPGTVYTVYIASSITTSNYTTYYSDDYCEDASVSFTTLADVCEPPTCNFTVHNTLS
jgi:hypothetical protein